MWLLLWSLGPLPRCNQLQSFLKVDVHVNWLNWFHFLTLVRGLFIILRDCIIFLSTSSDVIRRSMSTVSFHIYVNRLWNFLHLWCFPLTYDLNGFMSRINRHALFVRSFEPAFLHLFNLFVLLILVIPCLVVDFQSYMERILIKEKKMVLMLLQILY